jgi:S1-C subfamily serine protease
MLTHAMRTVLGAALAAGLLLTFHNPASGVPGISLPGIGAVPAPGGQSAPLAGGEQAILTTINPGLVIINTTLQYDSETAAGTGIVINADGLVLTNNHVIDHATKITAMAASTGTTYTATVVGYDKTLHGMIQTNADIVPGDSGGPLASSDGVIGMDTAGSDGNTQQASTGFAIPINTALSVARQIAAGHASSIITIGYPPFAGIFTGSGSDSSPRAQAQQQSGGFSGGTGNTPRCYTSNSGLSVPSAIAPSSSGALIIGTTCGRPAAAGGITGGAVITAVNGQAVSSPDDLTSTLSRFRPGDTVSVTWVSPSGQQTTSRLHLAAGPPQ